MALLLCVALALGGCSLRFAYSQLDWLVPWYVRDYVTLDAGQRGALDTRLADRLAWHCSAHIPEYAATLREAQAVLARETVDGAARQRKGTSAARPGWANFCPNSSPTHACCSPA
jgi:hypothetical protein